MVSMLEIQAALISLLKASSDIVQIVGAEIREDEWSATNFKYPCVRVHMGEIVRTGECLERATFAISSNSTEPSSRVCLTLADLLVNYLDGKSLVGDNFRTATPIVYVRRGPPTKGPNQRWTAMIQFRAVVSETVGV